MNGSAWHSFGDSQIGPLHIKLKINNQDAWRAEHFLWGDIIALSDGLGSKDLSEFGSQAACDAVIDIAKIWQLTPEIPIENLLKQHHDIWLKLLVGKDISQCACTCLFAIRTQGQVLLAQLGDGIAAGYNKNSTSLFQFDTNEDLFSNQTEALGKFFHLEDWQYKVLSVDDYDAFYLASDGISDDIVLEYQFDFFNQLYKQYQGLSEKEIKNDVHKWISQWPVPAHTDDKTLVCLYR